MTQWSHSSLLNVNSWKSNSGTKTLSQSQLKTQQFPPPWWTWKCFLWFPSTGWDSSDLVFKPVFTKENTRELWAGLRLHFLSRHVLAATKSPRFPFPKNFHGTFTLNWNRTIMTIIFASVNFWLNFLRNFIRVFTGIWSKNYTFSPIFLSHEQSPSLTVISDDRDYCGNIQITGNQEWLPVLLITAEVSFIFPFSPLLLKR